MNLSNCIPYITYFLFLFLLVRLEVFKRMPLKKVRMWEFVGFLMFFGLRGFVMSDASQYYEAYQSECDFFDWSYAFQLDTYSFEPGFRLFEKISNIISGNYFFFQFINSLIDFVLLDLVFRKYSKFYTIGFLVFFMIEGWMYEINLLRNMKSILLFIISLEYLYERNIRKYLFLNILGSFFHLSAFFYIPLYWTLNKRFPRPLIICIIVAGIMIPLLNIKVFNLLHFDSLLASLRFANYFLRTEDVYKVGFRIIERAFICILILRHYHKVNNDRLRLFFNLYILYFASFNILYEIPIFPMRVAGLFLPAAWIVVPFFISSFKKNQLLSIINIVFLYGTLIIGYSTYQETQKYTNILFSNETYEEYISRYESAVSKL